MSDQLLSIVLSCGSVSAVLIGAIDVPRARRGLCPPGQPIGLFVLAACFAWLAFAVAPA